jgi:hypothetical protein
MKVMRVKTPARVIVSELRKSVSTRVCRWLLIASGVVGVLSAGLVAFTGLQGIQAWLTPFASVRNLLSGHMGAQQWAQVAIIVLLWVVTLNAAGILRVQRVAESDGR